MGHRAAASKFGQTGARLMKLRLLLYIIREAYTYFRILKVKIKSHKTKEK